MKDHDGTSMPLSEHEQRILDEIERRLSEDDPKFARDATSSTPRGKLLRRVRRAGFGFVVGFVLLLVALFIEKVLVLGIPAFAIMLTCAVVIATTIKNVQRDQSTAATGPSWFEKMEQRWKKRFDGEDS